jgi:hypothetical protein
MSALHDKLAEMSAQFAFEAYKAAPNREEFKQLLAAAWEEHKPKLDAAAGEQGKIEYVLEVETHFDFTIKEIEKEDMLPPEWAAFVNAGHTFNWKFDHQRPYRYQFAFRWGPKHSVLLKEHKRKYYAEQEEKEATKKQRTEEPKEPEPVALKPLPEGTPDKCPEHPNDLHGYNVLFHSEWYGYIWGRVPEETDQYEEWIPVECDEGVFAFRPEGEQYTKGSIQRSEIRDLRFAYKKVGPNGSTEF